MSDSTNVLRYRTVTDRKPVDENENTINKAHTTTRRKVNSTKNLQRTEETLISWINTRSRRISSNGWLVS